MKLLIILFVILIITQNVLTAPINEENENTKKTITKRHIIRNFVQGLTGGNNAATTGTNVFGGGLNNNRPFLSNLFSNGLFPGFFSGFGNVGNQQQGLGGPFSGFHLPNYPIVGALGNGNLLGHGSAGFGNLGATSYSGLGAGTQHGFVPPLQGIGGLAPAHSLSVLSRHGLDGNFEYKPEENQMYSNNFGVSNYNNGFPNGFSGFGATGFPNY